MRTNDDNSRGKWITIEVSDDDNLPTLIMYACNKCGIVSWVQTPFCGYCGKPMDKAEPNYCSRCVHWQNEELPCPWNYMFNDDEYYYDCMDFERFKEET
jgi:NADH pyrophosphatase NudC (nudix superfamily)